MEEHNQQPDHVDIKLQGGVTKQRYEPDYIGISLFVLLLLVVTTLFVSLREANPTIVAVTPPSTPEVTTPAKNYFEGISLEGQAVYVWDIEKEKVLYAQNEEAQLPLASIAKLMTVAVANQFISPNDTILIQDQNLYEEGDNGLLAFEEWNAKDLIDFTLLVSSNDGADVLASAAGAAKIVRSGSQEDSPEAIFVAEMNDFAKEIGLKQTYFLNETGLDPTKVTSGAYGSARDAALLMEYIVEHHPELVDATTVPTRDIVSLSNFVHTATNTNQNIGNIPGLIASKTGFTDLAGGNLVIAFDAGINRPIVVSVLGSSLEGRFTDVEKLVDATLKQIAE